MPAQQARVDASGVPAAAPATARRKWRRDRDAVLMRYSSDSGSSLGASM